MTTTIHQADVLQWLAAYDGPRYHAILADPPYALISIAERFGDEDAAPAQHGTDGAFARASGGFMGMRWDGGTDFHDLPSYQRWVTKWARLLIEKAVHPGAVGMFFGGARTSHRLACGLEDAGWLVKDTLMLMYGSGFPKSLDVSKSIDKAAGAEREVIGTKVTGGISGRKDHELPDAPMGAYKSGNTTVDVTAPATEAAAAWSGWHSPALKPAYEPILLAIAPRQGMTHAELAQRFGTGALNIDGGRIGCGKRPFPMTRTPNAIYCRGAGTNLSVNPPSAHGRFPANVLLQHAEGCTRTGTKRVDLGGARPARGHGDADDMEETEAWSCAGPTTIETRTYLFPDGTIVVPLVASLQHLKQALSLGVSHLPFSIHSGDIENKRPYVLGRVPHPSELQDSQVCYPVCFHSCDALVRGVGEASRESAQRLIGALVHALVHLRSRSHTLVCPPASRPSSSDDFLDEVPNADTYKNRNAPGQSLSAPSSPPYSSHNIHRRPPEGSDGRCSNDENNRDAVSVHESSIPSHNACTLDGARRLVDASMRAAAYYVPIALTVGVYNVGGCPVKMLDEQSGQTGPSGDVKGNEPSSPALNVYGEYNRVPWSAHRDSGGASRFFYTAKSSRSEREHGLLGVIPCAKCGGLDSTEHPGDSGPQPCYRCHHSTVKPIAITKYLATLLLPPPVASPRRILVPFAGVGSEMLGAMVAGWDEIVGIEREEAYIPIAKARLAWWAEHPDGVPEAPTAVEVRAKTEQGRSRSLDSFSDAQMEEL